MKKETLQSARTALDRERQLITIWPAFGVPLKNSKDRLREIASALEDIDQELESDG